MALMNTNQENTAEHRPRTKRAAPLHKWLASEIRNRVHIGDLLPGQPLETEAELSDRYDVSRGTVRQALATLVNEGMIDRQAGRGSFIRLQIPKSASYQEPIEHHFAGITPKISRIRVLVDCSIQPPAGNFVLTDSIEGLSRAAQQSNGSCKLSFEYHRIEHADDPVAKAFMEQDDCDGMIVIPTTQHGIDFLDKVGKPPKPTTVLYRRINNPHMHRFAIDNDFGAYQATDYLLRQGHRRIALLILTWPDSWPSTLERLNGYRRAMREAGCEDPALVASANNSHNPAEIKAACKQLFSNENRPTAFLVNNFANLAPSLEALDQMQLRVPEDVSLIAFDESKAALNHDPQISVIHLPLVQNAMRAMEHLHHAILNKQRPGPERLQYPEIRLRQSCKPLNALDQLNNA